MENKGGNNEVVVGASEGASERVFGGAEAPLQTGEVATSEMASGVQTTEAVPMFLPPTAEVERFATTERENAALKVEKDAERIPVEFMKHVVAMMREQRKDPNRGQDLLTDLKWKYMGQAYDRDLGDGLHGKVKD